MYVSFKGIFTAELSLSYFFWHVNDTAMGKKRYSSHFDEGQIVLAKRLP